MLATPSIPLDLQSSLTFSVNGRRLTVTTSLARRLSRVLRDDLGLTGTKVGCDAVDATRLLRRLEERARVHALCYRH